MATFTFLEVKEMEVMPGRPIPLEKALLLLDRQNREAIQTEKSMYFTYSISQAEEELLQGEFEFPIENFDLLNEIKKDILAAEDSNNEEVIAFLSYLESLFPKPKKRKVREKKDSEAKKEGKTEKAVKPKKEKRQRPPINKKMIGVFFAFASVVLLTIAAIRFVPSFLAEGKPGYSELVQKGEYFEAGENYPEKVPELEDSLYQSILEENTEENRQKLQSFNEQFPTTLGSFDLAILATDYQTATELYENDTQAFEKSNGRLELAGYSYLKIDNLEQAKMIAEQVTSISLEEKIFKYEQLTAEIAEKEKELEELAKGGSKNRKEAETVANEKFKLKEERLNL